MSGQLTDPAAAATTPPAADPATPAPTPPAASTPAVRLGADGTPFDPERMEATLAKLRERDKIGTKAEKDLAAVLRALGVDKSLPAEPAELQQALADERAARAADQAALAALKVDHALDKAIARHGGNADTLAPFMRGSNLLSGLDAGAETFAKDIAALVKSTIDKFPQFKVTQVAAVSGAPNLTGSGADPTRLSRDDLKKMSPSQIDEARKRGDLEHLGVGRN